MSSLADLSFQSSSDYTFIEEIGRGGMGIVYLAEKHCEGVSDLMVLKTIRTMTDAQVDSLKREANVAAGLRHENIVRSYGMESIPFSQVPKGFLDEVANFKSGGMTMRGGKGVGKEMLSSMRMGNGVTIQQPRTNKVAADKIRNRGKKLYLMVMDYIDGWDLRDIYARHVKKGYFMPLPISAFIVSRICRSLEYAHEFIVHRDISPENVLISDQGVTKLTDFGIAVAADEEVKEIAGKLQYMAPEQIHGQNVDNRTDIFALGLVAYQLATGISLFLPPHGVSFREQVAYYDKLLEKNIIAPHKICKDVPVEYSKIIMKMLALDADDRYATAGEACSDIEKKYIYAKGFGPTNNSVASYLKIFESNFTNYDKRDLQQLSFMADDQKRVHLKRRFTSDVFTDTGMKVLKQRRATGVLKHFST